MPKENRQLLVSDKPLPTFASSRRLRFKMQNIKGPEPDFGMVIPRSRSRSRSASISSDSQLSLILAPPSVNPPPSFIAPASASQIVTSDQEFNTADFVADEDDDSGALVTAEALSALNGFLDHLLLNILAAAKSTQLAAIRPAVADVLKPRLANLVVSVADEELSEYLGEEEDEQVEFRGGQSPSSDFDLIHTWKLTRLRCMVYTRLGDMEEDDEEEYIAQEGLVDDDGAPRRFTSHIGNITPAAAIFLTSIIEHIGEQALIIAGETARSRLSSKVVAECDEDGEGLGKERGSMNRLVVEELDVEKLALNPTFGRLWRTWRKRTRTPNLSRLASRDSLRRRNTLCLHSRKSSFSVGDDAQSQLSPPLEEPQSENQADVDPVSIPLPMGKNDIQEIENSDFIDTETGEIRTMQAVVAHKVRPQSLTVLTLQSPRTPSTYSSSPVTPVSAPAAPGSRHARSQSLPTSSSEPPDVDKTHPIPRKPSSPTTSEERRRLATMYEHEEREELEQVEKVKEVKNEKLAASPAESSDSKHVHEAPLDLTDATSSNRQLENVVEEDTTAMTGIAISPEDSQDSTFLLDETTEIIQGHGTAEKPTSSAQRSKRNPSKDVSRGERSSTNAAPTGEQFVMTVVESSPATQNEDIPISVRPAIARTATTETTTETVTSQPPTPGREIRPSFDSVRGSASNSGDSSRSSHSRTQRPNPLHVASGSQRSPTSSVSSSITERAAVQRISTRPSNSATSSPHSSAPKPRRSDSFGSSREKRPMTANSATSQKLKGLINRPNDSVSSCPRRDSEGSRVSGGTGNSSDDKSNLDELIRSEETLHFTLTPKSVREMDFPTGQSQRSNTAESADGSEDANRSMVSPTRSQHSPKTKVPQKPKPAPIVVPRAGGQQRPKPGLARDARPIAESSSDLAQFIRMSGPASPPIRAKSPGLSGRESSDQLSRKSSRADSALSNSRGPRLQARSPGLKGEGNSTSDLIDFIREGPATAGTRRIPRTVAPFRTTMDSDDLAYEQGAIPSGTSTQGESTTKSQASAGSRKGLLHGNIHTAAPKKVNSASPGNILDEDDPRPKRTQRRVPDPYALDWDDEELEAMLEEEEPKKPKKPVREEESLIDFLRNVPPPPDSEPQVQPIAPRTKTPTGGFANASSMKARLLRSASSEKNLSKGPSAKTSQASLRQQSDHRRPSNYTSKSASERNTDAMYGLASVSERQTETGALADFLRSTGPPEPPRAPPKQDSGFSRFFVRRKKVEA